MGVERVKKTGPMKDNDRKTGARGKNGPFALVVEQECPEAAGVQRVSDDEEELRRELEHLRELDRQLPHAVQEL